ncbi:hypothetical protein VTI74DRAFT_3335 [Chaetomium olivicolor]
MASFGSQSGVSITKITKGRGKVVKPILKKLSHSEKNSLDLDRGWDEQQVEQLEVGEWDGGFGYAGQAKDVTFGFAGGLGASDAGSGTPTGGGSSFRTKMQHGRSGSQTSAGSGPRGAFVHPFAQTPRTSTPPLSYANSLASFDNGRDHSPTITENEDNDAFDTTTTYAPSHPLSQSQSPPSLSQGNLRRPSLNIQRTSSFPTDIPASKPPSLRINTTARSVSGTTAASSSRFLHGSLPTGSSSDLHITSHSFSVSVPGALDSPTGSLIGSSGASLSQQQQSSQISPLRTSLDMAGFPRLRAKSELDTATRNENIRVARRKFEERERAKEEKYDREMIRKRERRDNKEASRIEKGEAPSRPSFHRKRTPTGLSSLSGPPSVGIGGARTSSNRTAQSPPGLGFGSASAPAGSSIGLGISRRKNSNSPVSTAAEQEKLAFDSCKYENVPLQPPPNLGEHGVRDVRFDRAQPRRSSSAKHKTQSYWHGFILWLRTKLLRLSHH